MIDLETIQFYEQHEHEGQIPFLDFSFFPVSEDMHDLVDDGFGNFESPTEDEVDTVDLKSGNSEQKNFFNTPSCKQGKYSFIANENTVLHAKKKLNPILIASSDISKSPSFYGDSPSTFKTNNKTRFKPIQEKKWNNRFDEFVRFVKENGHGAVPYIYPINPQLARWVKRQRRQYKLSQEGKSSTMTIERIDTLSSAGFIWDTHEANWKEKLAALDQFRLEHGHCHVPTKYKDQNLGTWVKCQRRHFKLFSEGKPSSMNYNRIEDLEKLGFDWEIRNSAPKSEKEKSGGEQHTFACVRRP